MSISCAVKMVILSVSRVEYSISSSEMQNAAAVLASKFWRQPNKYVYSLYTRLIVLLPSKLQFQDYAFCYFAFETEMSTEHSFRRQGGDGGRRGLSQFIVWCSLAKFRTLL